MELTEAPNAHGAWLVRGDTPEYKAYIREVTRQPDLPDSDERFRDTDPYVTCSFCASLHPDEFLRAAFLGAKIGGSDWKYGYPHKFYVDWPNPEPERLYPVSHLSEGATPEQFGYTGDYGPGGERGLDWREEDGRWIGYGKRLTLHTKFYSEHLVGWLNDERAERIKQMTGIHFSVRDGRLHYAAPHHGYQR